MSYYLRSRNLMNSAHRYIWFDLETTGFNSYHEHIIEIAAYSSDGEYFNELVKPSKGAKISNYITNITHITNEMVKNKPTIKTVLKRFLEFCGNRPNTYLIAHNLMGFDKQFLERKLYSCRMNVPDNWRYIDSLHLAQFLFPERYSHSLKSLTSYFNIKQKAAHRAYSDVEDLHKIYNILMIEFNDKYKTENPDDVIKALYGTS